LTYPKRNSTIWQIRHTVQIFSPLGAVVCFDRSDFVKKADYIWTVWKFLSGLYNQMTKYEQSENFSRSAYSHDYIWTVWKFLPGLYTQMTKYEQSENFSRSVYSEDYIWTVWKSLPGLNTQMSTYEPSDNFSLVCILRWLQMNHLKISPRSVYSDLFLFSKFFMNWIELIEKIKNTLKVSFK
jgi:hypothetical protein